MFTNRIAVIRCAAVSWGLSFMFVACVTFVGPALPVGAATVGTSGARAPNVLIVLTDDQRATGTMQVLPNVVRWFGDDGRTFTRAFDITPLCCPSRAEILTGRDAHNTGIEDNAGTGRDVFDQHTTIERYLQDAGYRTALFGKFFNFWRIQDDPAYFDRWGIVSPSHASNGYSGGEWNVNGSLGTIERYSTTYIAAQGARFIQGTEADDAQPWFLELATYAPHLRAVVAPKYRGAPVGRLHVTPAMTEQDRSDKPPFVQAERMSLRSVARARAGELRTLMSVDDLVSRIAATLRSSGEAKNTLAFFLSDNGFLWGEHGLRSKGSAYTPGTQLPFLVRWPGRIAPGTTDGRLVGTIDIAPTILAAAGIAQDADVAMDGRSLLEGTWARDRLLMEYWPWNGSSSPGWASLRGVDYQYVEYYNRAGNVTFREYYDLANDPWELTNLLHDRDKSNDPGIGALERDLTADRTCSGTGCP
jgi:arylsulfatase A-like enzyme